MYILLMVLFMQPVGTHVAQGYATFANSEQCEAARVAYLKTAAEQPNSKAVAACTKLGE